MNAFVQKFVELMPEQFLVLWTLLNFNENNNLEKRSHLQAFYLRMVLYQFIAMNRIRNSQTFSWWALCNAAARYGSHDVQARANLSVHYGISITQNSLQQKLSPFNDYGGLMKACETKLSLSGYFGISVWDNSQLVTPLKFQRGGRLSVSSKVTSRIFVKPYEPTYGTTQPAALRIDSPNKPGPVKITYLDQAIPSPVGMALFECHEDSYLQIQHIEDYESALDVDVTGLRVKAYIKLVLLSDEIVTQKRLISIRGEGLYLEEPATDPTNDTLLVADYLQPNRSRDGFYHCATRFQRRSTRKWRKDPPRATVLAPPVSPDDETTTRGAGKVILSILLLFGLLVPKDSTAIQGNVSAVALPADYQKRWLVLVGDGLSQMRLQAFKDMLDTSSYSFEKRYEMAQLLSKALDQCVALPGDLHGGGFHFLVVVFNLYYGGFIQPIQTALGWKRIRGKDVTQCYQQAAGLITMTLLEVERQLYQAYLETVSASDDLKRQYDSMKENPSALAIHLAEGFLFWVEERKSESTDEVLLAMIQFVEISRYYRLFRESSRAGDSITMEYLYNEFIPIWLAVGKHHYYEIGLGQIEELYARIPFHVLQLLRVNRTVPLYEGSDKTGRPMANWALDALIELLQHKYKAMQFPNSIEGWQSHSGNMPLVSRCQNFSDLEYSRCFDVEAFDSKFIDGVLDMGEPQELGHNAKRQKTAILRRAREKQMIAEILSRSGACREQPQRKMRENLFWDELPNLTTILKDADEVAAETACEQRTEEELAISNITD